VVIRNLTYRESLEDKKMEILNILEISGMVDVECYGEGGRA
jgi:hypothetical protein